VSREPNKRSIVNNSELVEKLAEDYEFTKVLARDIVENVFEAR